MKTTRVAITALQKLVLSEIRRHPECSEIRAVSVHFHGGGDGRWFIGTEPMTIDLSQAARAMIDEIESRMTRAYHMIW
jgi:hypothetical protein